MMTNTLPFVDYIYVERERERNKALKVEQSRVPVAFFRLRVRSAMTMNANVVNAEPSVIKKEKSLSDSKCQTPKTARPKRLYEITLNLCSLHKEAISCFPLVGISSIIFLSLSKLQNKTRRRGFLFFYNCSQGSIRSKKLLYRRL